MNRREQFLEATANEHWRTLEEVVEDLDLAGYWPKGLADATKREHAREMIATQKVDASSPLQLVGMNKFVSLHQRRGADEPVQVYKQIGDCTFEELGEVIKQMDSQAADFRRFHSRLREAVALLGENPEEAADILLDELTDSPPYQQQDIEADHQQKRDSNRKQET